MPADFTEDFEAMQMCMDCGHTYREHSTRRLNPGVRPCDMCSCEAFSIARIAEDPVLTVDPAWIPGTPEALAHTAKMYSLPQVPPALHTIEIPDPLATAAEISAHNTPKRSQILRTADQLINGDRQASYGDATESFERLGRLWSEVMGTTVTAEQVALCLIQLKVSRLIVSNDHADSWVDLCGYSALGGEIADTHSRTGQTD